MLKCCYRIDFTVYLLCIYYHTFLTFLYKTDIRISIIFDIHKRERSAMLPRLWTQTAGGHCHRPPVILNFNQRIRITNSISCVWTVFGIVVKERRRAYWVFQKYILTNFTAMYFLHTCYRVVIICSTIIVVTHICLYGWISIVYLDGSRAIFKRSRFVKKTNKLFTPRRNN